jgi:hypothetical protein
MDQEIRNKLRNVVTQCRKVLEDSVSQELEGKYAIFAKKDQVTADPNARMTHLTEEEQAARKDILDHYGHIKVRGFKPKEALDQLVREIAFTHLNRLCAYKMMEARGVYIGGQKFREAVSRGFNSNGVKFYLADNPEEERLFNTGHQDIAYRHFLDWLGGLLSEEIGVLFSPNDPANRLHPRQKTLDEVLDLLNHGGIKPEEAELGQQWPTIWAEDETIGWVYQYFTPKELRDQARKESQAPRNSYELAFRNQFFTPRYVVEFLTDNTLGRIWYEMRRGETKIKDQCRCLVRRPTEIFLKEGEQQPEEAAEGRDDLSQEELLKLPVHIPHRPKKDPRELKILDPACGSAHFLLYCFDLLLTIYKEAYADPDLGPALQKDYPRLEDLQRDVPRLILAHNLHGIDIDLRATQIAGLALWLRCQRAYQEMGLNNERPKITRSNIVCAEPMPGEEQMLKEFVSQLEPKFLGQVVEVVFERMKFAGVAGSLLKIEEEIQDAVAAAKKQWVREVTQAKDRKGQPLLFTQAMLDRIAGTPEQDSLFDLSGITDDQFFEQAEAKVIDVLRQYAEKTQNGERLQRRLFTDDAVRGFAFVDLCRRRYDVVLMNPPFGQPSEPTRTWTAATYTSAKEDVDACFVSRTISLLDISGFLGAIFNRTQFFKPTLAGWRKQVLLTDTSVTASADLGFGVLDGALVEAATYCLRKPADTTSWSVFCRLLRTSAKSEELSRQIASISQGHPLPGIFGVLPRLFLQVPAHRISYWMGRQVRELFVQLPRFQPAMGVAKQGLSTADDFRFLRLFWEVDPRDIVSTAGSAYDFQSTSSPTWVPVTKGGEYSPYFQDVHMVIDWTRGGQELKSFPGSAIRNPNFYFRRGITYSERTASGFSPRVMPPGCIFTQIGPGMFPHDEEAILPLVGLLTSRCVAALIEMLVESADAVTSGSAARHYTQNVVGSIPIPILSDEQRSELQALVHNIWLLKAKEDSMNEDSRYFVIPEDLCYNKQVLSIRARTDALFSRSEDLHLGVLQDSLLIEEAARKLYRFDDASVEEIEGETGIHPCSLPETQIDTGEFLRAFHMGEDDLIDELVQRRGGSRAITKKCFFADRRLELLSVAFNTHPRSLIQTRRTAQVLRDEEVGAAARSMLSYSIGCAFGRWDVRFATGERQSPELPDPFDPLPVCAPGMIIGADGLPAKDNPPGYPLHANWDGILLDDPDHKNDIVRRVREVLELIWEERPEAIEQEACKNLGVKELRDYFRRLGKGGFWDDHITRYSKSRRKAPIYWLLQSSKKNYVLWLYCHRLDKDLLYKALVNYVEPKIRLEASRLEALRSQKDAARDSGKDAKRLAKEIERLEDFLSELGDFEDKLRRAAELHLEPDLNDGVVLNIAPLHELVPWGEAEKYWEELLEGKYEWSSIGKQLRQKGLVK